MPPPGEVIGRKRELEALGALLVDAREGRGALVLVAGEAGVGKTRLVEDLLAAAGVRSLGAGARQEGPAPYEPVVAALRGGLRREPRAIAAAGPLAPFLGQLLPELGEPPPGADGATLVEALCAAFLGLAADEPLVLFLDDLQWADGATLELLAALSIAIEAAPLLVVGAYRSDEIPRSHPLRRLRRDLRRAGRLRELALEPLDAQGTAALAARVAGEAVSRRLAGVIHDRTQGVPFFVEELAAALAGGSWVRRGPRGLELADVAELPLPDTIRDAVLLRATVLSEAARGILEVAAVAGSTFDLGLLAELAGEDGLDEPFERGFLVEGDDGGGRFRHALTREAIYADTAWAKRRQLHRRIAARLERSGEQPALVARHWLAAREPGRALPFLVSACERSAAVHAHRDALAAGRQALELWPAGKQDGERWALLERLARCAELCGELAEAVSSWRELAEHRGSEGDLPGLAEAERRLANAYALQGAAERSLAARRRAAEAWSRADAPAEAAGELLAAAAHLESAGVLGEARPLVATAAAEAERAGRDDLRARAIGLEGTLLAKSGEIERGLAAIREGLQLALEAGVPLAAAELYTRLANAFENAADYRAAEDTYRTAYDFCRANDADDAAQVCLACLAVLLLFRGEWDHCAAIDRDILAAAGAGLGPRMAATQHLGLIAAMRGESRRARRLLLESGAYAARHERQRMQIWHVMAIAWLDELDGDVEAALEGCRMILEAWGRSEALHYPVPALRWVATFLARHGAEVEVRACAQALAELASQTANTDALAGLAQALGEVALLDGDPERAAVQFLQAIALLRELELPVDVAHAHLRAGAAFGAAEQRDSAVEHLTDAYRIARRLGARPLAARAVAELAAIGEPVERRLGRRAAAELASAGLTRRELEIVRHVALGRTNREIARELFLSPRTVDMHVHNVLVKLGCRSRAEATFRATELGLIGETR